MEEMFSFRDGLNLEISKLSRMRSSKLEEEREEEIIEKLSGVIVWWVKWVWDWIAEREVVARFFSVKGDTPCVLRFAYVNVAYAKCTMFFSNFSERHQKNSVAYHILGFRYTKSILRTVNPFEMKRHFCFIGVCPTPFPLGADGPLASLLCRPWYMYLIRK